MILQTIAQFAAMVRKNLLVLSRYPISFISSFISLFVIVLILLFAVLMFTPGGIQGIIANGTNHGIGGTVIYGLIPFLFVSDTLWIVGYSVRLEQYQGTLESLYITPASPFLYLASRLIQPLISTALNTSLILLFVHIFLGSLPEANKGLALYTLVFTLVGISGLSFCYAAFTLLVKESAEAVANVLRFVLLAVCAMFFPFHALSTPLLFISRIIPLSYGVDLFRSALMGFPPGFPELASPMIEVIIVTVWGLAMPFIGYAAYRWVEHRVRTDGSLTQY